MRQTDGDTEVKPITAALASPFRKVVHGEGQLRPGFLSGQGHAVEVAHGTKHMVELSVAQPLSSSGEILEEILFLSPKGAFLVPCSGEGWMGAAGDTRRAGTAQHSVRKCLSAAG